MLSTHRQARTAEISLPQAMPEKLGPPMEGIQVVTPILAAHWLAAYNYIHQRKMRPWHVASLARMMSADQFRQKTQVNFVRYAGKTYLTNGQHTLSAIVASDSPQLLSVIVNDVEHQHQIAEDFSRHDTHLTRQLSDALAAHETHITLGVTVTQLRMIVAASAFYGYLLGEISTKSSTQMTHDEKLALVAKHGEVGKGALALFAGFENESFLTRRTTLAVAMACHEKAADLADQFWPLVASDDGLLIGDPRKTLRNWLRDTSTAGGSWTANRVKRTAADHEFVKAIALCWNAWIQQREYKLIKIDQDLDCVNLLRVGTLRTKGKAIKE